MRNTNAYFPNAVQQKAAKFTSTAVAVDASATVTTNLQLLCTGAAGDSLIRSISASSTNASSVVLYFFLYQAGVLYPFFAITVPANSGTDGATTSVNVLDKSKVPSLPIDDCSNTFSRLANGVSIYVGIGTQPAAGKYVSVICSADDY